MSIHDEKGSILILSFMVVIALTSLVGNFLYSTSVVTKSSGFGEDDDQGLWLAEAGIHKAIWNLTTTTGDGGQGEDWTTAGTTENLGDGNYKMVVARWDWSLSSNSSTASATSSESGQGPELSNDANDSTYWESVDKPTPDDPDKPPQELVIAFPYTLTLNKVRFLVPSGSSQQRPKQYTWQVSADNVTYTTVVTANNNSDLDVTDTFTEQTGVNYLMLRITKIGGGDIGVRIATLEAIGSKITSTGTVGDLTRTISVTAAIDDATDYAFEQIDWVE